MQASGGGAAGGAASSSWMASLSLDFLSVEELMGGPDLPFLDPATLLNVCGADIQQGSASGGSGMAPPTGLAGMQQQQKGLKRQLPEDAGSGDDSDEDECRGGKTGSGGGKRGKGETSNAARVKASKEKARRGKINDRFAELAKLIEPGGSEPKTDKPSILADAIKYVQQLTIENHQLRQLNKFLEERVAGYERERGQNLYQQSLSMQGVMQPPQQGMMLPQQQGMVQSQQAPMMQPQQAMMQPQGMQQPMMQPQPSMMPVQHGGMQQGMVAGQGQGQGAMQPMMGAQQQAAPAAMMPGQQPLMQTGMAHMPMQQTSTSGAMGPMHMQPQAMQGQQHQMGYQQQQMGYQQPPQQQMVYQQQQPQQQAQQEQAQLKSEPSVDNSSQQSGSRQATSVEGESAPASAPAAVSASPQPTAVAQHAPMAQPGAPPPPQQQLYGAVPVPAAAPGYYYPSGLKPSLVPTSGMPFGGMQAMHMGALPAPHWPNMGVDSAQQDSLLRPPVA